MRADQNLDHKLGESSPNNLVRAHNSKISLLMKEQPDQGLFVCCLPKIYYLSLG